MTHRFHLAVYVLVGLGINAQADDWPQFRGPHRDGVSREKGLLKAWPKTGPELLWTFKNAGLGFSSIAVVGDVAYLSGTHENDEVIIALDVKDSGKELWTAKIGPIFTFGGNVWGDGPRGTPTVEGDFVYALGGQGDLVCADRTKKGKEIWRKNLSRDLGGEMMTEWGYSESPLVDGDLLICTPGGNGGTFAALNKKTGEVVWRSKDLKNKAPYSSVVLAQINGVRQYIGSSYVDGNVGGVVSGIAAKDGKVLWSASTFSGFVYAISPTPIVKDNLVYITTSAGCSLIEVDKNMKVKELYGKRERKKVKNNHGGVVLVGNHIFGHTDPQTWICQDFKTGKADGDKGWDERDVLTCVSGSITAADGKLYLYTDQGEVALIDANPAKFSEISKFTIPQLSNFPKKRLTSQASKAWSYPAIANGRLFLRDCEFVYCYKIK